MKMAKTMLIAGVAAVVLGGCAYPRQGSADYSAYGVRGEQEVRFGVVESVRLVRIQAPESGVGTAAGAALGGVAGSTVGGGSGQIAGAIAGMVLGGILGQAIEQDANQRTGLEITVLLDSGKYLAITQEGDEQFRSGDRVRVLSGRGGSRVTH
ncbi:Outer membrane lipoprotein pcp [Usitatibacter rugosus]|uniref:Outer membrane lipoprotein pcp n=1 Tax=Usitatibacter rugosus TaxID=2732067 RepID=A0A6M4H326_9PROT|nr:glycine zipper 2TM domain-containing protein [Usitatibacter rugosus]QJR13133.1 Outer membrane lipoprotein pcp [Usitatibacter rugosus]